MRTSIYILCLLAAFLGGKAIAMPLMMLAVKATASHPAMFYILKQIVFLVASVIPLLVLFRVLAFIKTRSIRAPETFKGPLYIYSVVVIMPVIIVIAGYSYVGFVQKAVGLSGIPLGLTVFGAAVLLALPVVICESREFYKCIPGKRPNNSPQRTPKNGAAEF